MDSGQSSDKLESFVNSIENNFGDNNEKIDKDLDIFYTRKLHYNEDIYMEQGFDTYKPTLYEILIFLIMRISGRWTQQEREYIFHETGYIPDYENHLDKEALLVTSKTLREFVKKWKNSNIKDLPLTGKQIDYLDTKLERIHDEIVSGKVPTFECEGEAVHVYLMAASSLPLLEGAVAHEDGSLVATNLLIDSGAAINCMRLDVYQSLGKKKNQIDRSKSYNIVTAGEGQVKALGTVVIDLFALGLCGKWYKFQKVKVLILSGGKAPPFILGIKEIRERQFQWSCRKHGIPENICLSVKNRKNETVRRKFATVAENKPKLTNLNMTDTENGTFQSSALLDPRKNYHLTSTNYKKP